MSLKTIQGLTKYVLSIYQEEGYAGIYVYIPVEAVEGTDKLVDKILPNRGSRRQDSRDCGGEI